MRVVIVTQYFPPETGGPQNRLISLAKGIAAAGHDVHVITEKPNYPTGIIWQDFKGKPFIDRTHEGIPVTYTWIWEDHKKRFLTRIRFYMSFVFMAVAASLRLRGPVDVVLASSPPLFVGLAGWMIGRLKRAKFVFDVRDLWPDVAVAMGELDNPRSISIAKRLERFIYERAHGITAVTESFCSDIRRTAGPGKEVVRVTNGTVPETFRQERDQASLRQHLDLPDGFIATFAGNMGLAQGLEHLVDAAALLAERDPDVTIVLVGEGVHRDRLQLKATDLPNVVFRPRVSQEEAARYMAASDALLVPLARSDIYKKFIPSKLFDSMACGRPVLLSVDGESREIVEAAQAGVYYPAEDAEGCADAILRLKSDLYEAAEMGRRGAEYVAEHFSRENEACKMAAFLEGVAGAPRKYTVPLSVEPVRHG